MHWFAAVFSFLHGIIVSRRDVPAQGMFDRIDPEVFWQLRNR